MYFQHHIAVQKYHYGTFALEEHMCAVLIKWQVCLHTIAVMIVKRMITYVHVPQVGCGSTQYNYLITHNVSSDRSPITVNRMNVTLYGVQPGETYTVEICPYVTPATMSYFATATATVYIEPPMCTVKRGK